MQNQSRNVLPAACSPLVQYSHWVRILRVASNMSQKLLPWLAVNMFIRFENISNRHVLDFVHPMPWTPRFNILNLLLLGLLVCVLRSGINFVNGPATLRNVSVFAAVQGYFPVGNAKQTAP